MLFCESCDSWIQHQCSKNAQCNKWFCRPNRGISTWLRWKFFGHVGMKIFRGTFKIMFLFYYESTISPARHTMTSGHKIHQTINTSNNTTHLIWLCSQKCDWKDGNVLGMFYFAGGPTGDLSSAMLHCLDGAKTIYFSRNGSCSVLNVLMGRYLGWSSQNNHVCNATFSFCGKDLTNIVWELRRQIIDTAAVQPFLVAHCAWSSSQIVFWRDVANESFDS